MSCWLFFSVKHFVMSLILLTPRITIITFNVESKTKFITLFYFLYVRVSVTELNTILLIDHLNLMNLINMF